MKNSILPLLVVLMLAAHSADAQQVTWSASQSVGTSNNGTARSFAMSATANTGGGAATHATTASYAHTVRAAGRTVQPGAYHIERSSASARNTAYQSQAFKGSYQHVDNSATSQSYNNGYNLNGPGFTVGGAVGHSGGGTGSVNTDTMDHCGPRTKLMDWLLYSRNLRRGVYYPFPPEYALFMLYPSPSFIAAVEDYVVSENDRRSADMYTFYDGYIVYCQDTAYGMINLMADGVYFDGGDLQLKIPYKHEGLRSVVLFNDNNEELFLTRIGNDKILSRVLHNGKLVIYDSYYSFNKADFSCNALSAAYQNKEQRPLVVLDSRLHMIKTINRVYGSDLKLADYDWHALVQHINTLD